MTASTATPDRRRERGARTRRTILEASARLAGVEGLEGLSIGRLASYLQMSKSGLFAHFRSKEELQLATIRTVMEMYDEAIVAPAMEHPPGRDRLLRFVDRYLDYLRDGPLPGGCFFIASMLDPARLRDRVRELLAENQAQLLDMFEECVREGQRRGEIAAEGDPRDLAFAVDGLLIGADLNFVLFDDANYLELGRTQVRQLLA